MRDVAIDAAQRTRARRRRRPARRLRPRGAGAWPGHAARHQLDHRRRRPHARRRLRLADASATGMTIDNLLSATIVTADGSRAHGVGDQRARPLLGAARRRRQLRRRHLVRVPPASGRTRGLGRAGRLSLRASAAGAACVARFQRHGTRRAERVDGAAQGAAAAVPARVGPRHRGRDLRPRRMPATSRPARAPRRRCRASASRSPWRWRRRRMPASRPRSTRCSAAGGRNYWKSNNFAALGDAALEVIVAAAAGLPGPECEIFVAQLGGAMARVTLGRHRLRRPRRALRHERARPLVGPGRR